MKIDTKLRDLIFSTLFKQQEKGVSFFLKDLAKSRCVFVECSRVDGAIGIKDDKTEWVGGRVAAANRLAIMNVDIDSLIEAGKEDNFDSYNEISRLKSLMVSRASVEQNRRI